MDTLKIAVSARALFDLDEANMIFKNESKEAFVKYVKDRQDTPLKKGVAFRLVKDLLRLNTLIASEKPVVEVIINTSFSPTAGISIIKSVQHYNLPILRMCFTGGAPATDYLDAFGIQLLLTKSKEDAQAAINKGIAAGIMYHLPEIEDDENDFQIKIALDGDAVIFSDESERVYQAEKLDGFIAHEQRLKMVPMAEGPFAPILRTLYTIQKHDIDGKKPIRIAMVTARGGLAAERPLRTMDAWGIQVDEAHFLSGWPKAGVLKAFKPHIYFDDQNVHVEPASDVCPSALVPIAANAA